jgi:hypothetical protein
MFESVGVGGFCNGKEVEAPHASGDVQIARQLKVMPVLCRQRTICGFKPAKVDLFQTDQS